MSYKREGDYDIGMGGGKRARGNPKPRMRIMVPSKMAGSLIGKGGANIQRLRNDFSCNVRIPDCPGPERIMEITSEEWDNIFNCLENAIPYLYECPDGVDDGNDKELKFLIHQSIVGGIIGKGGEKIKEIRNATGANVKVYQTPAPQSTERCCQANGTMEKLVLAAREIFEVVQNTDIKGMEELYDPINFDAFYANDYGGFGTGSDQRKALNMSGGGRGGMMRGGQSMMGGMRGMGGPRGGYGGGFGGPMGGDPYDGGFGGPMMGRGGPMGGMRFGRGGGGGGFGRGGFGGDNQWGGGFGGGAGNGGGPDLNFKSSGGGETESTQVTIPNDLAGAIIGPGGQRIRKIRNDSKASITIGEPDSQNKERIITITGDADAIQNAQWLLQQSVREHGGGAY